MAKNKRPLRFYRIVDRAMRAFGDINFMTQTMRLNPKKGDMLNTIIHEDLHAEFPKKNEKRIHKLARKRESKLSIARAIQLLEKFRPRRKPKKVSHYKTD